ncbi:MAG: hypothetical protein E4H07_01260 [Nitrosomonadales bacterium]|jgi:hypothetical protein|nr:MAG: hypothetical protein E4H07_01260 [Nitrosomonadales bacterium]
MNEDWKIIVKRASRFEENSSQEGMNAALATKRWVTSLVLIPILIVLVIFGIFFFAVFLALFAIAAVGFGIRFWWLRRELTKSVRSDNPVGPLETADTVEGEYVVVEEDQAAETEIRRDEVDR